MLRAEIDSPTYDATYFDPRGEQDLYFPVTAPYLKLAAVQGQNGIVTLFALNRHLTEPMPLTVTLNGHDRGVGQGSTNAAPSRSECRQHARRTGHGAAGAAGRCCAYRRHGAGSVAAGVVERDPAGMIPTLVFFTSEQVVVARSGLFEPALCGTGWPGQSPGQARGGP